jgi:hypothetical protein
MSAPDKANLLACLRRQVLACAHLGSPFYAALVEDLTADVEAGGPGWDTLAPWSREPFEAAVTLRFLGSVHRLVLAGRIPDLARHYPSVGGDGDAHAAWRGLRDLLATRPALGDLGRPPQTNEVGRAAALACGFLTVAGQSRRPLRLLEIGASAGLNLRFDHYRYDAGTVAFGDPRAPVRFAGVWEGVPPFDVPCTVVTREGCDAEPVDPTTDAGRLTLVSYVWPDQRERLATLSGALDVAARVPAPVERARAADWLGRKLGERMTEAATVVFHSIVWQYLSDEEQRRVRDTIEDAARRASSTAPLAWLRLEPSADKTYAELRLLCWPGDADRLLATAGFHGRPVRWLGQTGG